MRTPQSVIDDIERILNEEDAPIDAEGPVRGAPTLRERPALPGTSAVYREGIEGSNDMSFDIRNAYSSYWQMPDTYEKAARDECLDTIRYCSQRLKEINNEIAARCNQSAMPRG